jgi:alpha-galactosidase
MKHAIYFHTLLLISATCAAQQKVTIPIETSENVTILQTDEDNRLNIVYFGKKLSDTSAYPVVSKQFLRGDPNNSITNNAYTPSGTWNLSEPAIQIKQPNGDHSLELKYISHTIEIVDDNVRLTSIILRDPVFPVEVKLFYKAYRRENVMEQWCSIRNAGKKPVMMEKIASANLYIAGGKFFLRQYHGDWAEEMIPEETELTSGIKVLDSKLGTRADLFQPPSFAVSIDQPATENNGEVILASLAWTGNFKIDLEKDSYQNLRLIAGINPYAAEYELKPAETFETPALIYTLSHQGKGTGSRNLHAWATKYRLRDGKGKRLTLLNNWESTYFDFDETKLKGLFKNARDLGVDMFLLDDGWFGNKYPRNNDVAGLGDWQENKLKLPHGLGYLVKEATAAGIKFGIWVEPEMVNPKSELYEKHRDWVIRHPDRKEYYFRNQLVLDLANPEVSSFVFGIIDSMLTKNPDIAFIKWDCNAVIYNAYSAYLAKNKMPQSMLYVRYVKALYGIMEKIKNKFPSTAMMLCSGGGGRVDYGALKYFTEYWPSDNTDPLERVFIQWENSYFFPAIASCNHVTDWSSAPLKFKIDVAMMGKLGFDIVVNKLSPEDLLFAKKAVEEYHTISDVVWHGDLYRLSDPWKKNIAALMYVSPDKTKSVVFNYLTNTRYHTNVSPEPIRLSGLDPGKKYQVKEINVYPGTVPALNGEQLYSGEFLMNIGINPAVSRSRTSVVFSVNAIP